MTQLGLGLDLSTKRTRNREFLEEMRRVVPWSKLIALIEPHYPKGRAGRAPFPIATMLQIHFMQQWRGLSDPAMEEALYDIPLYLDFAGLDGGMTRLPDESTILRLRHLLQRAVALLIIFFSRWHAMV
ncbi:Transposase domain [Burkholderia sp. GAS332]|nr:Transposase domain [Burkholderia sp. GAS332]